MWYVPRLPLGLISNPVDMAGDERKLEARLKLVKDIEKRGLLNPLIVLNHQDLRNHKPMWVQLGTNRLWAVRKLGWTHVPAIVTGDWPLDVIEVFPETIDQYFREGKVYYRPSGPRLDGISNILKGEWPSADCGKGVGQNGEDFRDLDI
jgi:hypothetical protein